MVVKLLFILHEIIITILISAAWGQVRGKEECNEYGCFKIFTEMDNWIDGTS